jgi:hypothetical protein
VHVQVVHQFQDSIADHVFARLARLFIARPAAVLDAQIRKGTMRVTVPVLHVQPLQNTEQAAVAQLAQHTVLFVFAHRALGRCKHQENVLSCFGLSHAMLNK